MFWVNRTLQFRPIKKKLFMFHPYATSIAGAPYTTCIWFPNMRFHLTLLICTSFCRGVVADSEDTVKAAAEALGKHGFINYFGMQVSATY